MINNLTSQKSKSLTGLVNGIMASIVNLGNITGMCESHLSTLPYFRRTFNILAAKIHDLKHIFSSTISFCHPPVGTRAWGTCWHARGCARVSESAHARVRNVTGE